VVELIAILKNDALKKLKLKHIHKFCEAGVPILN